MSSLIISSASRSSPHIFIYRSSHIILIPSTFHSIILACFAFPLIHFTIVLFAISSKLIFYHFIWHTLLFIIPSSFPSYFTSISLITTHPCFSFPFASMFSIHLFASIPISFFLSHTSITLTLIHFHSNTLIPFQFIISIHFLFLFHPFHPIHLISSLNLLITSLYLLSFSFTLESLSYSNSILWDKKQEECLDVTAFTSHGWFKCSRIEYSWSQLVITWRLESVGVLEAVATEFNYAGCALHNIYINQSPSQYSQEWLFQYSGNCTDRLWRTSMKECLFTYHLDIPLRIVIVFL